MMRVKRTTYAARSGNNEITKLGLEIKQIIKQLQEDLKKKDKIIDDYTKVTQSFKREYQTVSAKKKQVERFFTKTRTRKTSKIRLLNKTTCYNKMLAMQKRKQSRSKRKRYYDYDDSDSSDYEESIEDDYERRKKKPSNKKNKVRVEDVVDDDDVDGGNQSEESEMDEKPKKRKKKEGYHNLHKTMNLVNLSI